ncbi:MAG: hypothetical protein ACXU86_25085 [Archangium sp.]
MADTPKIPTGKTKEPTDKGRGPPEMTNVGDDQYVPDQRGQNFQPRNAGALEDAIDEAAARVAKDLKEEETPDTSPSPIRETPWEARTERDEEWVEQEDKDAVRNRNINEDVYPHEAPANEPDER